MATIVGTEGDDVIGRRNDGDVIGGLGGNDAGSGLDTVCGGDGDDRISGGERVVGGRGDDVYGGTRGRLHLSGGPGDEILRGFLNLDLLEGRKATIGSTAASGPTSSSAALSTTRSTAAGAAAGSATPWTVGSGTSRSGAVARG